MTPTKETSTYQNERLWNSNYNKVMLINFTLFFSFYLITPLLPLYLSETFHTTKDVIGFVLSGYSVVALTMRPFSGYFVDSFPRKKVLMVCLFVNFLFFGGYLAGASLLIFALLRTLHGGPFGASTVANSTMAIDVLPSARRNEGIGYYGLSNNLASAIAPMAGLYIYNSTHNFQIIFWIALITASISIFLAQGVKVKPRTITKEKSRPSLDRFFLTRGWFLAFNILFFGLCWGILSSYIAIYGKEHLGITSGTGTFFLLLSLGLILSRLQGAKSLRKGNLLGNAMEGILLSTIGYTVFIAFPSMTVYYISALLIGLGNGHMWPAFQNMIISVAHHNERGTANSTILSAWDLGMGAGVLAGGVIAEHFGYDATFWTMAAIHIAGLLIFFIITRPHYCKLAATFMRSAENQPR